MRFVKLVGLSLMGLLVATLSSLVDEGIIIVLGLIFFAPEWLEKAITPQQR